MAQAEEIWTETGPLDYDYTEKEVELCQENLQNHKACSPDKNKNEMLNITLARGAGGLCYHVLAELEGGTRLSHNNLLNQPALSAAAATILCKGLCKQAAEARPEPLRTLRTLPLARLLHLSSRPIVLILNTYSTSSALSECDSRV
eukprot:g3315.t1